MAFGSADKAPKPLWASVSTGTRRDGDPLPLGRYPLERLQAALEHVPLDGASEVREGCHTAVLEAVAEGMKRLRGPARRRPVSWGGLIRCPAPPAHQAGGPEAAQDRLQPPRTHPGRSGRLSRAGARSRTRGRGAWILGAAERGRPGGRGQPLGLHETLPGPGALRGDPPGHASTLRPAPAAAGRALRP